MHTQAFGVTNDLFFSLYTVSLAFLDEKAAEAQSFCPRLLCRDDSTHCENVVVLILITASFPSRGPHTLDAHNILLASFLWGAVPHRIVRLQWRIENDAIILRITSNWHLPTISSPASHSLSGDSNKSL